MKNASPKPEVLTFGCRLNIAESETMHCLAANAGLRDTIIINTCAVTAEAERQAGQAIRRLKRENPNAKIIVTGCASQIDPQKYRKMREVDELIPNDRKLEAESFVILGATDPSPSPLRGAPPLWATNAPLERLQTPDAPAVRERVPSACEAGEGAVGKMQRAFVEVQNGCDNTCTFCIIPFGRGASRSVSFENVTEQVRARVHEGFNEVVLTGVDIASYGRDLPGEPTLGFMARHVLKAVPEVSRLRLSSLDPAGFDEDLWELIADEPRLMPHIHLSVQSGDDMILKRMKRRHTRADVYRLIERARKVRPDIIFGADIIAGFPTENEAMFKNTYDLADECGLTWLHVFPYSSRKGTAAAKMPQVHGSLRKSRADRLRALGEKAARKHHESLIGTTVKVLVENNNIGCTPQFAKIRLLGPQPVGQIVDARCLRVEDSVVVAEVG